MAAAPDWGAPMPTYISGYRLIALIGGSNFGNTYSVAKHSQMFAMKELKYVQFDDASEKTPNCSTKEFQTLKTLKHRNVVSYQEFFSGGLEELYIVMEYCELGNLRNVLTSGDWRVPKEIFIEGVMKELCCGMAYIHSMNVIHGNIKLENICVHRRGVIKIGDFKLFTILQSRGLLQRGTPGYISPECENGYPNTTWSDMWAVGRVLFDLCNLGTVRWETRLLRKGLSTELKSLYSRLLKTFPWERLRAADAHESLRNMINTRANAGIYIPAPDDAVNYTVSKMIIAMGLAAFFKWP